MIFRPVDSSRDGLMFKSPPLVINLEAILPPLDFLALAVLSQDAFALNWRDCCRNECARHRCYKCRTVCADLRAAQSVHTCLMRDRTGLSGRNEVHLKA